MVPRDYYPPFSSALIPSVFGRKLKTNRANNKIIKRFFLIITDQIHRKLITKDHRLLVSVEIYRKR